MSGLPGDLSRSLTEQASALDAGDPLKSKSELFHKPDGVIYLCLLYTSDAADE